MLFASSVVGRHNPHPTITISCPAAITTAQMKSQTFAVSGTYTGSIPYALTYYWSAGTLNGPKLNVASLTAANGFWSGTIDLTQAWPFAVQFLTVTRSDTQASYTTTYFIMVGNTAPQANLLWQVDPRNHKLFQSTNNYSSSPSSPDNPVGGIANAVPNFPIIVDTSNSTLDWAIWTTNDVKQFFLTDTSVTSFKVPYDWNPTNNTVETIGGGGGGANAGFGVGGIGGSYAKSANLTLTPGSVVPYTIGAGGTGGAQGAIGGNNVGTNGGDTVFDGTSLANCAVGAPGGPGGGSNGSGALTAPTTGVGTVVNAAGNVPGPGAPPSNCRGGSGAGGPLGVGGSAGGSTAGYEGGSGGGGGGGGTAGAAGGSVNGGSGGSGGNNVNGSGGGQAGVGGAGAGGNGSSGVNGIHGGSSGGGGAGGAGPQTSGGTLYPGGNGGNGAELGNQYVGMYGAGGGGGAGGGYNGTATGTPTGGKGGYYGGGGGAGGYNGSTSFAGGDGCQGMILITYTPLPVNGVGCVQPVPNSVYAYATTNANQYPELSLYVYLMATALPTSTQVLFDWGNGASGPSANRFQLTYDTSGNINWICYTPTTLAKCTMSLPLNTNRLFRCYTDTTPTSPANYTIRMAQNFDTAYTGGAPIGASEAFQTNPLTYMCLFGSYYNGTAQPGGCQGLLMSHILFYKDELPKNAPGDDLGVQSFLQGVYGVGNFA